MQITYQQQKSISHQRKLELSCKVTHLGAFYSKWVTTTTSVVVGLLCRAEMTPQHTSIHFFMCTQFKLDPKRLTLQLNSTLLKYSFVIQNIYMKDV